MKWICIILEQPQKLTPVSVNNQIHLSDSVIVTVLVTLSSLHYGASTKEHSTKTLVRKWQQMTQWQTQPYKKQVILTTVDEVSEHHVDVFVKD